MLDMLRTWLLSKQISTLLLTSMSTHAHTRMHTRTCIHVHTHAHLFLEKLKRPVRSLCVMISVNMLHVSHACGWKEAHVHIHADTHIHSQCFHILRIIASFPVSSVLISRWLPFSHCCHEGFPNLNLQSSWAPQIQCCDQKLFISYIIKFNVFTVALKLFLHCNSNPSL